MSESNEPVTDFTKSVKPSQEALNQMYQEKEKAIVNETPVSKNLIPQTTVDDAALSAQERVIKGLSKHITDTHIENMRKLAPQDKFTIGNVEYERNKIRPKDLRDLRKVEREYFEDMKTIVDPDLRQDRDWQLLAYKAKLYFGMTEQQFEETDIEYLQTVIQATELRTQGFRQY